MDNCAILKIGNVQIRRYFMFNELANKRFSVRKFSNKGLDDATLKEILNVALLAPTAKNLQPWRIYIIKSEDGIKKIDELTSCRYNAPIVLAFSYNKDEEWNNPYQVGIHSGVEDVSIVATHIMLKAAEMNVDTLWVNLFKNSDAEKILGLPKNEKMVLLMPIGYREEGVKPSHLHGTSRKFSELIKYI